MICESDGPSRWDFHFDAKEVQAALSPSGLDDMRCRLTASAPPKVVMDRLLQVLADVPTQCVQALIRQYVDKEALLECTCEHLHDLGLSHDQLWSWTQSQWDHLESKVVFEGINVFLVADEASPDGIKTLFYNATVIDPWRRCWEVGEDYIDGYHQYE
jgi:hypothetical protein